MPSTVGAYANYFTFTPNSINIIQLTLMKAYSMQTFFPTMACVQRVLMDKFQPTPSSRNMNPSVREILLALLDPAPNSDNHQGQYRLPPVEKSFIRSRDRLALGILRRSVPFISCIHRMLSCSNLHGTMACCSWSRPTYGIPLRPTRNTLLPPDNLEFLSDEHALTQLKKADVHDFLEDFAVRGLLWTENHFPDEWFKNEEADDAEHLLDSRSMMTALKERILWLACRLSGLLSLRYSKDITGANYFHCPHRWLEPLPKLAHAVRSLGRLLSAASHRFIPNNSLLSFKVSLYMILFAFFSTRFPSYQLKPLLRRSKVTILIYSYRHDFSSLFNTEINKMDGSFNAAANVWLDTIPTGSPAASCCCVGMLSGLH